MSDTFLMAHRKDETGAQYVMRKKKKSSITTDELQNTHKLFTGI